MAARHMAYGDPAGVAALRVAIAEHLRTARAVRCEADNVLVVSGSHVIEISLPESAVAVTLAGVAGGATCAAGMIALTPSLRSLVAPWALNASTL